MSSLLLAVEAGHVSPDHIAADIALPISILVFSGSVYLLLWANYGAKKGGLIYGVAFFGFSTLLGIFWWFGAPGTPVNLGPQNFPGQAADAYQGRWHGFEPGSDRAGFFPATNNESQFEPVRGYLGLPADADLDGDEMASFLSGDLDTATATMLAQFLPRDQSGTAQLGARRRTAALEAAGEPQEGERRADDFFTAELAEGTEPRVTDSAGHRVAMAEFTMFANFVDRGTGQVVRRQPVEQGTWFAFKDPGALWFPSAVWTGVSFLLFLLSLVGLDRMEQREKRVVGEVQEAEDLAVPVHQ